MKENIDKNNADKWWEIINHSVFEDLDAIKNAFKELYNGTPHLVKVRIKDGEIIQILGVE